MGPGPSSKSWGVPPGPRLMWDLKRPPWPDVKSQFHRNGKIPKRSEERRQCNSKAWPMSFESSVLIKFSCLQSTRRHYNETPKNFQSQFKAHFSPFNAKAPVSITESPIALMLLSNVELDDIRQASILVTSVLIEQSNEYVSTRDHQWIDQVKYDSIAAVPRGCDKCKWLNT